MGIIRKILHFFNPIAHLGEKKYSFFLPFYVMIPTITFMEFYAYEIAKDPLSISLMAIFLYMAFVIYFSFRSGISVGLTSVLITVSYYLYIMYSRNYVGDDLESGLYTTSVLGLLYLVLAFIIGGLKQTIDTFIEKEVNAKNRLLTIIRQLPVGVVIADTDGVVIQSNEQVKDIFGKKLKPGVKIGNNSENLKDPKTGKPISESNYPILKALRLGRLVNNHEYMIQSSDGKNSYLLINSAPIYNRNDKVVAGVSIFQDITFKKELEKRKDDFINMASHELKSPMTSLLLFFGILKKRLKSKDYKRSILALNEIEKQADNLQDIINNLLDVSRIQTGKIFVKKENFRLDLLVEDTVNSLQKGLSEQKIKTVKKTEVAVNADRIRIYQVLINLITNGVKYSMGKGDIKISVYKKNGEAIVSVHDFGIGIKSKEQKNIFEKLYQVKEDVAGTYPGFGMGLYISREIVKKHKGKIWLESEYGKESTFYFTLT